MGVYLNPGNEGFRVMRRGRYVDKSGLIALINETIDTPSKLTCISRPRRFGKSYAAKMLAAYYDRSCDSAALFADLAIASSPDSHASYQEHLNRYDVLYLDMSTPIGSVGVGQILPFLTQNILMELREAYPEAGQREALADSLAEASAYTGRKFIAIIDEWDAPIRDSGSTRAFQKEYLNFLRSLFKSSGTTDKIFAAAYMTGILPIKKDGTQSAISEFEEYTILWPRRFAPFSGFTEREVRQLCGIYGADFASMQSWYDGYAFENMESIYNPDSVMKALQNQSFTSYWKMSSAANSLLHYISLDYDGLAKSVAELMGGIRIPVDTDGFQNDLSSFESRDDVLTLLIHFGYLNYDRTTETVCIPNEEIRMEFDKSLRKVKRDETVKRLRESVQLVIDTVEQREERVAAQIQKIHLEECSPLFYSNEQSLRSVVKLAYFSYRDYFVKFEELPGGKGFADIVYIPKPGTGFPALLVELKCDDSPEGAIAQIRERQYPDALSGLCPEVLLVGIQYDKKSKEHKCKIEKHFIP